MIRAMKIVTALLALAPLALPASAHAAVGDWAKGQQAEARLLAAGIGADGKLDAAVEIVLPVGWHTYWRQPGEAGVPTTLDFAGSANVGAADVAFPVPERDEDGSNIYRDHVVLPITFAVADPGKPAALALDVNLGVCQDICVPDEIKATLAVPPGEKDPTAAAAIAAARATLPGAPTPGAFAIDTVTRTGGTDGRPIFHFTGAVPDAAHADFFVEGPGDWAPYLPQLDPASTDAKAVWDVQFSRLGSTIPIPGATFRVTIRSAGKAIEQMVPLS